MAQHAGDEFALQLVVDREGIDRRAATGAAARQEPSGFVGRRRIAGAVEALLLVVHPRIAQVLAEGQRVIEVVRQHVADRGLLGVELVEARLADEARVRNEAAAVGPDGAGRRQELQAPAGPLLLIIRQEGDRGVVVRLHGDGGSDEDAIVLGEVDLGLAVARDAGQAPQHRAFLVGAAADIEFALIAVEAAAGQRHFAELARGRQLADIVEDAAGAAAAVHRGGWSLQDFEALGAVGIEPEEVHVVAARQPQAVEIEAGHRHVEAADLQAAEAGIRTAVDVAADTCGVAQCRADRFRALVPDLVRRDDRDRLRGFDERRVGLGRRRRARRNESGNRATGALTGTCAAARRRLSRRLLGTSRTIGAGRARGHRTTNRLCIRGGRALLRRIHADRRQFRLRLRTFDRGSGGKYGGGT
ncbi:hypothetical protein ACVILL_002643 [Bradyrhizobium sp. USDA 3364]